MLHCLLEGADQSAVNMQDMRGFSPLHLAVQLNRKKVVQKLTVGGHCSLFRKVLVCCGPILVTFYSKVGQQFWSVLVTTKTSFVSFQWMGGLLWSMFGASCSQFMYALRAQKAHDLLAAALENVTMQGHALSLGCYTPHHSKEIRSACRNSIRGQTHGSSPRQWAIHPMSSRPSGWRASPFKWTQYMFFVICQSINQPINQSINQSLSSQYLYCSMCRVQMFTYKAIAIRDTCSSKQNLNLTM